MREENASLERFGESFLTATDLLAWLLAQREGGKQTQESEDEKSHGRIPGCTVKCVCQGGDG